MQKVKIIAKTFNKKAGGTFTKLTIKGQFVPDVLAEDEVQYQVKFTAKSEVKEPVLSGIYEVAYNDGELWIDTRAENIEKHIVRITARKVKFFKALPRFEKDIREVEQKDGNTPF